MRICKRRRTTIMTQSEQTISKLSRRQILAAAGLAPPGLTSLAAPWIRKSGAAEIEKVRMAAWSPRLAEQANIYVSEHNGFFKEQGIELEWIPGQGSGDALKNMIAGNGDIAFVGPEAIYLAADKGSKLKAVYDIYPTNVFNVFALKSKQSITPQDLKG